MLVVSRSRALDRTKKASILAPLPAIRPVLLLLVASDMFMENSPHLPPTTSHALLPLNPGIQ